MHKECGPSIHVGTQQAETLVSGVPRLDHDIVQLVAQEVLDHAFIPRIDFQKICEHANWSLAALKYSRLKQPPHRLSGITMLGNDGFERASLAQRGSELRAQAV